MINSSLPVQFYYDILLAENIKPRQFQKLWDYFNFTSHPCVPGVAISAGTRIIRITVNKKITGQIESGKVPQWLLRDGGKKWELTSSASILFSRRSSSLGLQRQKRTYCKKGKEFHKSERGLNLDLFGWGLAPCCCAVTRPRAERSFRKASCKRIPQVWRNMEGTERKILTNSFAMAFRLSDTKSSGIDKKKINKRGTRRRLWFNPFFLRDNTLSVGLSNHLAARLRFHIHSACLSGKAWLTALPALSYIQNLAHKED